MVRRFGIQNLFPQTGFAGTDRTGILVEDGRYGAVLQPDKYKTYEPVRLFVKTGEIAPDLYHHAVKIPVDHIFKHFLPAGGRYDG